MAIPKIMSPCVCAVRSKHRDAVDAAYSPRAASKLCEMEIAGMLQQHALERVMQQGVGVRANHRICARVVRGIQQVLNLLDESLIDVDDIAHRLEIGEAVVAKIRRE